MLDDASVALPGLQTAIGDAIGLADKTLKKYPGDSKALILLTDGKNNSGVLQPLQVTEIAKQYHIKIYTIGLCDSHLLDHILVDQSNRRQKNYLYHWYFCLFWL